MPKNAFNIRSQLTPTSIGVLRRHNVVYLDRGLIAINKPSGLITQGTVNAQKKEGTIQTTIEDIRETLAWTEGPYTVHRLDKATTGLYVLATTSAQAKILSKAFSHSHLPESPSNSTVKQYLALVHTKSFQAQRIFGHSPQDIARKDPLDEPHVDIRKQYHVPPQVGVKRRINLSVYINSDGLISLWSDIEHEIAPSDMVQAQKRKKTMITDVEVLALSPTSPIALVGLQLYTGVKHQLRVTMASFCRAPILGDSKYGSEDDKTLLSQEILPPQKMMLHSSSLTLQRFSYKRPVSFKLQVSPPWEFLHTCERLGITIPSQVQGNGVWIGDEDVSAQIRWSECRMNEENPQVVPDMERKGRGLLDEAWLLD
ncbi:pseudouridine synthase [Serendipita vermifera]|nr:pseudouridine synthase [Serendipita vermifera]